ncbi:hypothetical protein VDG1235_1255 [Verrucomicrobiia bacterium DG1235]|nr:hypothetical protein VDG1235_1255 [Verrucomicrobiae bacterium DG1235]
MDTKKALESKIAASLTDGLDYLTSTFRASRSNISTLLPKYDEQGPMPV